MSPPTDTTTISALARAEAIREYKHIIDLTKDDVQIHNLIALCEYATRLKEYFNL